MFEDSRIVFEVSNERGRRRRPNKKVMLKAINVPATSGVRGSEATDRAKAARTEH